MSKHFVAFGNHPALGLAELVSVLKAGNILYAKGRFAIVETDAWDGEKLMNRLGGTIKLGDVILETKIDELEPDRIAKLLASEKTDQESRSLDFGWTFFGDDKRRTAMEKFPMRIKKSLKDLGLSVRWVTGDEAKEISPAAVAKCGLTEKPNADLVVMEISAAKTSDKQNGGINLMIGRTTHVQNADAWSERDYGRPQRDDRGGMLPPKLARMMVNLAQIPKDGTVLDPFCGSGTVLMEAALASGAKRILGSDIAERCIHDTQKNDDWLLEKGFLLPQDAKRLEVFRCDARTINTKIPMRTVDAVVTEGWLGPPLRGDETQEHLLGIAHEVSEIWRKSLTAFKKIMKEDGKLVIVVPSYKADEEVILPAVTKEFSTLGFTPVHPLLALDKRPPAMFYQRQDQHLRRNVFVLTNTIA